MERKVYEIITVTINSETIHLEVIPVKDNTCQGCFFYGCYKLYCSSIRSIIGTCYKIDRTDNTPVIFRKIIKKTIDADNQSSNIYKKDLLGKWININDINPIEIKDLKPGNYVILRIVYNNSINFDYKLAYVDFIKDGKVNFHIQDINIARSSIQITDFCILPDYTNNNYYKTIKQ